MAEEAPLRLRPARLAAAAEAVLLVALIVAPWPYGSAREDFAYVLAALVLLGGSLWCLASFHGGRGLPSIAVPAAGLPLLAVAQLATGRSAAPIWTAEGLLLLAAMLTALVFWSDRSRERRSAERLAVAVLATCLAEAVFAAAQSARGLDRLYGGVSAYMTMAFGSFVNHNHFAGLVEMGALLAVGWAAGLLAAGRDEMPAGIVLSGVSLALVAVHVASRSRGGLVALVAGGAILAVIASAHVPRQTRVKAAIAAVAALAALALFALVAVPAAARQRLATVVLGAADPAGGYRLDIARDTLRLAGARPVFGWGLAAFADALPAYKRSHGDVRTVHAESDALELLAEGGAAGLLLVLALAAAAVAGLRDRLAHSQDRARTGLALGALSGCAALAVHSLVDFNLRIPSNALAFASIAGLAAAPRSVPRRLPPWTAAVAAGLLGVLAAAAAWRAAGARAWDGARLVSGADRRLVVLDSVLRAHPYLAEAHRARALAWRDLALGGSALAGPRLSRAEASLRSALRLRPSWGEAWADRAWLRYLQRDAAGARADLARSQELDPTNVPLARSRSNLGALLDRLTPTP